MFSLTVFLLCFVSFVHASATDGTVDPVARWAWSETSGWIDFGDADGNVHVTNASLSGYVWGENVGWISLNCSNDSSCGTVDFKVSNTTAGVLSGYAYGEDVGWIDFQPSGGGVTISSSGVFSGYAWSENAGWINFSITNPVTTDWRPTTTPPPSSGGGSSGGGGGGSSSGSLVVIPPVAPVVLCTGRGDLNNDNMVNLTDFSIGGYHWAQTPLDAPFIPIEACKLNADARVNLTDFSIMAYYWTGNRAVGSISN